MITLNVFGATVASFDVTGAKKVDGVVDVVQIPTGVAVLATDTWAAMRGREALKVTWDTSRAETRSTAEILEEYRRLNGQSLSAARRGNAAGRLLGVQQRCSRPSLRSPISRTRRWSL